MAGLLVIDVGSHKAEEVKLFEGKPFFSARNCFRMLKDASFRPDNAARGMSELRRSSQDFATTFKPRYILIEPVMHKQLLEFVAETRSAMLINGVSSCQPAGQTTLYMANNSLGNSIVAEKPGLTGTTVDTFNFSFPALYEFAIDMFVRSGDCDKVVVRMNAEGVEGPIIDYLSHKASHKPDVVAGSLGDIRKCFGQEAFDKAREDLDGAGIPFVYLTSLARSWSGGLKQLTELLSCRGSRADASLTANPAYT